MTPTMAYSPLLLIIAYLGFISLGLPDTVVGVAWPSVRDTFHLPQAAVMVIFVGTGFTYFLSSFFTGKLLQTLGIGLLLASSSGLVAVSALGYASLPVWAAFAACSLLHGFGSGAIDAGINHFVAHHFSARHMNWLHAFYSLGAMLGPAIMTFLLAQQKSWRLGYAVVAVALASLTLVFIATRRHWDSPSAAKSKDVAPVSLSSVLRIPLVWLQIAIFFVYTGLELTLGQWSYTLLTESRGISQTVAGTLVTMYWASILAGRILLGFVVERIGIDRLLRYSMVGAVVGSAILVYGSHPDYLALGLVLAGFGLSPVFPCLMSRSPQRLGSSLSAHAIGLQVSASMLGGAGLPSFAGFLAQHESLEAIPLTAFALACTVVGLHELILGVGKKNVTSR